jgi:hypothetical protein
MYGEQDGDIIAQAPGFASAAQCCTACKGNANCNTWNFCYCNRGCGAYPKGTCQLKNQTNPFYPRRAPAPWSAARARATSPAGGRASLYVRGRGARRRGYACRACAPGSADPGRARSKACASAGASAQSVVRTSGAARMPLFGSAVARAIDRGVERRLDAPDAEAERHVSGATSRVLC